MAGCGAGGRVSFFYPLHGGGSFLFCEQEDWTHVEQRLRGGSVVWCAGVWVHVLGGDAAFECETRAIFLEDDHLGGDYAYRMRRIADCAEREEILEVMR